MSAWLEAYIILYPFLPLFFFFFFLFFFLFLFSIFSSLPQSLSLSLSLYVSFSLFCFFSNNHAAAAYRFNRDFAAAVLFNRDESRPLCSSRIYFLCKPRWLFRWFRRIYSTLRHETLVHMRYHPSYYTFNNMPIF